MSRNLKAVAMICGIVIISAVAAVLLAKTSLSVLAIVVILSIAGGVLLTVANSL